MSICKKVQDSVRQSNVFIKTFGCQMNVADSERMRAQLEQSGYTLVSGEKQADIVLLNTCSVRQLAEEKVWGKLGQLGKNGTKIIGVTGCMAQRYGKEIFKRAPYVNIICGTYSFHNIDKMIDQITEGEQQVIDVHQREEENNDLNLANGSVSAWVPIMRGCNNYCSYCVVPAVRGEERSRSIADVVKEIESMVASGVREVTLLGQNVNSYKSRSQQKAFPDLLKEVNAVSGLERIRFVTSHPKDACNEMFQAMAELNKVCEYLHLPVQSGSSKILVKMNRKYTRENYLGLIAKIKGFVPDIALSTDIIVGFPGETDTDFQETYDLMKEVQFSSAFIFKYSPRSGTAAAELEDDVPLAVKKKRNNCLLKLQDEVSYSANKALIGKSLEVLVEGYSKNNKNRLMGRTRTNKIVVFEGSKELIGKLVTVKIVDATNYTLYGSPKH